MPKITDPKEIELCLNSLPFPDLPKPSSQRVAYSQAKGTNSPKSKKQKEYYQNKVHNELTLAWALLNTREFSFIQNYMSTH